MAWPLYRSEALVKGNLESQVGIICLFTQKERILLHLSNEDFALLGQLYNPSYGVSVLVRNCLANKNIRYLVICGQDLSGSGETLIKLKGEGVEEVFEEKKLVGYKIKGLKEARMVEKEIPLAAINLFREKVKILDYRHLTDFNELKDIIKGLEKLPRYGEDEIFPEGKVKPERFPAENSGFKVTGDLLGETWLKILDMVMKLGILKRSEHAEDQKEILNLTVVLNEENPDRVRWEEYFQFSKEHFEEYVPLVVTDKKIEGVHYSYGRRLKDWRGINQIESIVRKLKKSIYSRRAVAVTWDVEKDHDHADAPCIDLIQCLVQEGLLFMTVFIRSNDMFEAWPENALALRKLQFMIASEVGIKVGSLTTISGSAHIYEKNWKKALDILERHPPAIERLDDSRGNFVISVKDGLIKVEHQSPEGNILEVLEGKTAGEIGLKLVGKQKVSELYHAFYLGKELEKAEIALREGLEYEQEKKLDLRGKKQ